MIDPSTFSRPRKICRSTFPLHRKIYLSTFSRHHKIYRSTIAHPRMTPRRCPPSKIPMHSPVLSIHFVGGLFTSRSFGEAGTYGRSATKGCLLISANRWSDSRCRTRPPHVITPTTTSTRVSVIVAPLSERVSRWMTMTSLTTTARTMTPTPSSNVSNAKCSRRG